MIQTEEIRIEDVTAHVGIWVIALIKALPLDRRADVLAFVRRWNQEATRSIASPHPATQIHPPGTPHNFGGRIDKKGDKE